MIRRACWIGALGTLASLSLFPLAKLGVPPPLIIGLKLFLPGFFLWGAFRKLFVGRIWIRLFLLMVAFGIATLAAMMLVPRALPEFWVPKVADIFSISESMSLIPLALMIPLILGTPSFLRTALSIGIVVVFMLAIHFVLIGVTDPVTRTGIFAPPFWYVFGCAAIRWGLLFAALAPDHIVMERAARARKTRPVCEDCDYDLTGNVSGVCPECGVALSDELRRRVQNLVATPPESGFARSPVNP